MHNLTKTHNTDPSLISLTKTAHDSLVEHQLDQQNAAVYLVLDHSGSMRGYYRSGAVQRLAEQALGLSANLDDDGTVPLIYFGDTATSAGDLRIGDHAGAIDRTHTRVRWGSTNYAAAIHAVTEQHTASGSTAPALVIFQSDGEPNSRSAAADALRYASKLPIFFAFIGFGNRIDFLEKLDDLPGRVVDNASFFHASDPHAVADGDLYDELTAQFATWLTEARNAGITG